MATSAQSIKAIDNHQPFRSLAFAMAAVVVVGFSTQLAMGRSTFASPPMLHLHAVVFFGWTALFLTQTVLVGRENFALHRKLGWIGAGLAAAVVSLGIYMTVMMVRRGGVPFFFTPSYFLFMNSLAVLGFGGLTFAAIRLRKNTQWHRRLMTCGMAILTGPALGRILPMPLLIPFAGWAVFVALMLFPVIGMAVDLRKTGRIHPAWWVGVATITSLQVAMSVLSVSPPGLALYHAIVAGGAGEHVPPLAYPPFPAM